MAVFRPYNAIQMGEADSPQDEEHLYKTLEFDKIRERLSGLTASAEGRRRCLELRHFRDIADVRPALQATADAESVLLEKGTPPLQAIHDLNAILGRLALGADLNAGELMRIASFLGAADRLKRFVPADLPPGNILYDLMRRLLPLPNLARAINSAVLGEDEIADSASPELASIRRKQRSVQDGIRVTLEGLLRSHASALQEALITQRGGRYVLPVKAEHRGQINGVVHDTSGSGATLFIEPMAVLQANNRLRELGAQEAVEIERILAHLSALAAAEIESLRENEALLGEIDFDVAKARLSLAMKATTPMINDEGRIRIRQARHPLIPPRQVVPIQLELGYAYDTLVITGPNTGGKTVALKTLGLLTLMAQSGLNIPAREESELAVFERILADIGDEQSIEQNLSTFSAHMKQIVRICEHVNERSLVLLDELGSGTDPTEGAALAIALLDHFKAMGARTMATTHYRELKVYALREQGVENACCEFDTETLRPTYRLLVGVPGVSNAFIISQKLGLAPEIIDFARQCIEDGGEEFERLIREVEAKRSRAEREREAAEQEHRAMQKARQQAEAVREELEQKRGEILADARESSRSELEDALELIDAYMDELRDLAAQGRYDEALREGEALRRDVRRQHRKVEDEIGRATLSANKGRGLSPEEIKEGESYYSEALGFVGKALGAADAKGNVFLQHGSLKVRVKASGLRPADSRKGGAEGGMTRRERRARVAASNADRGSATRDLVSRKRMNFSPEIKLLGQTSDEAIANLDRFLDEAVLAAASTVRIVHGKGSGVLRKAVQDFVKKDRRVKRSRLAAYGEGDSGVTIAELR